MRPVCGGSGVFGERDHLTSGPDPVAGMPAGERTALRGAASSTLTRAAEQDGNRVGPGRRWFRRLRQYLTARQLTPDLLHSPIRALTPGGRSSLSRNLWS